MTRSLCIIVPYPGIGLVGTGISIMQIILIPRPPTTDQGAHHLDTDYDSNGKARIEEPMHSAYGLRRW